MNGQRKKVWLVCVISLLMASCGYHFSGGGDLPGGIRKIHISVIENKTAETGMENTFTNDLINEFTRASRAAVTTREDADAVLSGIITSVNSHSISHRGSHTSLESRVVAVVDIKITYKDDSLIWQRKGVSQDETYDVNADQMVTEQNRAAALSDLSKKLAEKIHMLMTSDF